MNITIPPNCRSFPASFFPWLIANQVVPQQVDDSKPVHITDSEIVGVTVLQNTFRVPIVVPLTDQLAADLDQFFGEGASVTVLDDLAQLVNQLREARDEMAKAKDRADEARAQILARLHITGASVGTVHGRPAVEWKTVTKSQFQTAKFRADHKDLADEYTTTREENRLELL
jgi:hypothetical protein